VVAVVAVAVVAVVETTMQIFTIIVRQFNRNNIGILSHHKLHPLHILICRRKSVQLSLQNIT